MGILSRFFESIKEADQEREDIDDDKTTDRYLRSLRRQRRTQLEELEKEQLKNEIKDHEKMRTREAVLGIPQEPSTMIKKQILQKKISIMKAKQFMIPKKKPKNSMFSRGNL